MKQKGFIGAIGDDLPSLIPIVVALLLFFSIFTLTLNTYNSKNFDIRKQIGLMSISRSIKGESLIQDIGQFNQNCNDSKLKKHNYNYMVGLYYGDDIQEALNDFQESSVNTPYEDSSMIKSNGEYYFCGYKKAGGIEFTKKRQEYLLRYYPVAVQHEVTINGETKYFILPSVMAMVVWE
jgi:hypothetical protein